MNKLVSVIIPAYNAEKFIAETIASVLNQSWQPLEVIVVNDGSTDRTEDVVHGFNNTAIRYFSQRNSGSPVAKNLGLSHAAGEYIQFIDADDLLSPGKIEEQVIALENNPEKVAVCRTRYFDETDKIAQLTAAQEIDTKFLYSTDNAFEFLLNLNGAGGSCGMIQPNAYLVSRRLIDAAGNWSDELNRSPDDDSEFFCRILLKSGGVVYTPHCLNYYRKLPGIQSLSKQKSYEYAHGSLRTIELKTKHLLERDSSEKVKHIMAQHNANFIYRNFSYYPELVFKAEKNIRELGFHKIPSCGGRQFKILSTMIGVKNALSLRKMLEKK